MLILLFFARVYLPAEKGKVNLLMVIFVGVVSTGVGLIIYFFTSNPFRSYVMDLKNKYKNRISIL
jgi:multisubunit Na+/H+ antiporter MnhB subunit